MTNLSATRREWAAEHPRLGTANKTEDSPHGAAGLVSFLKAQFGLKGPLGLRDRLEAVLRERGEAAKMFSEPEREMLLRVLRFGALRIEDVMVPRADIIAIDESAPLSELLGLLQTAGHSRIPVYRETLDDPRGMAHIKDLVSWITKEGGGGGERNESNKNAVDLDLARVALDRPISSTEIVREVLFVPPSMSAVDLFLRMQSTHIHLALVIDEYGGTDGLVSIEDLVEEVVGEIEDEHDETAGKPIRMDPAHGLVAVARTPIEDLEAHLRMRLLDPEEDEDIDTLGGLVFSLVNRVPVRGEIIPHPAGIEFEVLDADPRRIKLLKIIRPAAAERSDADASRKNAQASRPAEMATSPRADNVPRA